MKKEPKKTVEEYTCLRINDLVKFNYWKEDYNKIIKQILLNERSIEIGIKINGNVTPIILPLDTSETAFNGTRIWFQCPKCRKRVANLYFSNYGEYGCRSCLNLTYEIVKYRKTKEYEFIRCCNKLGYANKKLSNKWLRNKSKIRYNRERGKALLKISDFMKKEMRVLRKKALTISERVNS